MTGSDRRRTQKMLPSARTGLPRRKSYEKESWGRSRPLECRPRRVSLLSKVWSIHLIFKTVWGSPFLYCCFHAMGHGRTDLTWLDWCCCCSERKKKEGGRVGAAAAAAWTPTGHGECVSASVCMSVSPRAGRVELFYLLDLYWPASEQADTCDHLQ